ncbi:MAG TPA: lipoprotein-releasing ABC transporter permease subunit [Gammaproteobacteria bacterium]|nr:lipoprotein-releasing ABC transporter permease subunit [Gammaproteobacteria bacterium]
MFRPAFFFIGLRYTRAKRRNHFISFISLMSMLGIALGVLVLITVLSVMNGFDGEIRKRVFSMVPPITVTTMADYISNWQDVERLVKQNPNVISVAPFVTGQILITNDSVVQPAILDGIDPALEKNITELPEKMVQGQLDQLIPGQFDIILGEELANRLNASVGDKITIMTPEVSLTPAGVIPRFKRFTLIGIFRAGSGFGFDGTLAFINLHDGQKLMRLGASVSGVHASIKNVYAAQQVSEQLLAELGPNARITNWTEQFGALFHAVSLEKTMMFFILLLIIAVAVFNLVCTLMMVVNDKEADIAILRTFGATPRMIMGIFVIQGAIVGVVGTFLGVVGGIILASNVTKLVDWIEAIFHVQFLSSSVYFVNYLPSELQSMDVIRISLAALIFSLLATLYPAWRASRTEPVEALRYE